MRVRESNASSSITGYEYEYKIRRKHKSETEVNGFGEMDLLNNAILRGEPNGMNNYTTIDILTQTCQHKNESSCSAHTGITEGSTRAKSLRK